MAGGFTACAVVLAAASFAWACESGIFAGAPAITADPSSVTQGTTTVQLSGRGWTNGQPVVFHWGSEAGARVGSAIPGGTNGVFNTSATIPAVAAGDDYQILAVQGGTSKVYGLPFRVTAPTSTANPGPPGTASGSTSNSVALADADPAPVSEPATATTPAGSPSPGSASTSGRAVPVVGSPSPVPTGDRTPVGRTGAAASSPSLVPDEAPAPLAAVDREAPAAAASEAVPSKRTASGDLWGGFSQAAGMPGPGLTSLPAADGGSSNVAVGLGLLSAGIVALFAGFGVAEGYRRRVLVTGKAG